MDHFPYFNNIYIPEVLFWNKEEFRFLNGFTFFFLFFFESLKTYYIISFFIYSIISIKNYFYSKKTLKVSIGYEEAKFNYLITANFLVF
jgi:hypothetical protein